MPVFFKFGIFAFENVKWLGISQILIQINDSSFKNYCCLEERNNTCRPFHSLQYHSLLKHLLWNLTKWLTLLLVMMLQLPIPAFLSVMNWMFWCMRIKQQWMLPQGQWWTEHQNWEKCLQLLPAIYLGCYYMNLKWNFNYKSNKNWNKSCWRVKSLVNPKSVMSKHHKTTIKTKVYSHNTLKDSLQNAGVFLYLAKGSGQSLHL